MLKRLSLALAGVLLGGTAVAAPVHAASTPAQTYYLALGDSLSRGVQPDATGASLPTNQGYVDDLYAAEHALHHNLRLAKLGCPGESTTTMLKGGICSYTTGSQVGDAAAFLKTHRVSFVTIDIGANDVDGCFTPQAINRRCIIAGIQSIATNLPQIMAKLRAAAPTVPIYALNYYDPFLAVYLLGGPAQQLAFSTVPLTGSFNTVLSNIYKAAGAHMVNIAGAFRTFRETLVPTPIGPLPVDVLEICRYTWMCVGPPMGPNIHANPVGYGVMAATVAATMASA